MRRGGAANGDYCYNVYTPHISTFDAGHKAECENVYIDPTAMPPNLYTYSYDCSYGCTQCMYEEYQKDRYRCTSVEATVHSCPPMAPPPSLPPAPPSPPLPPPSPPAPPSSPRTYPFTIYPPDVIRLSPSEPFTLFILYRVSLLTGAEVAVGRSYDGHAWEGGAADPLFTTCATDPCSVSLSAPPGHVFRLDKISRSDPTPEAAASRFLLQATFGPTRASIEQLAASGAPGEVEAAWVEAQMQLEPTLLRAYFRKRASPTVTSALADATPGGVRSACDHGSRWQRSAFGADDVGSKLFLGAGYTLSYYPLVVKGVTRTVVDTLDVGGKNGPFNICSLDELLGGEVVLSAGSCNNANLLRIANPPIRFTAPDSSLAATLNEGQADFEPLAPYYSWTNPEVIVLQELRLADQTLCAAGAVSLTFLQLPNGVYYRHDAQLRLSLLENTLASPAVASSSGVCPSVPKTLFNAETCVRAPTCSLRAYSSAEFELDMESLSQFYALSDKPVYRIAGLRLEDEYSVSPCTGSSRWRRLDGACGAANPAATDFANTATRSGLANALAASSDSNQFVRDITVGTASICGGDEQLAVGAVVDAASECWEHVHPDLYNVYDFDYWSLFHPGGYAAIMGPAFEGAVFLTYQASHPMERWMAHVGVDLPLLGRLGDRVDFADLPSSVQTVEMASWLGALPPDEDTGYQACGSPGEVRNEPSLGSVFGFGISQTYGPKDGVIPIDKSPYDYKYNGRHMVWAGVALRAADQLRQRVAFALSEVLVVGNPGMMGLEDDNEMWQVFYDIFVRNAFGNYLDILREVSYSPMMAKYLSFVDNTPISCLSPDSTANSCGSYPDENYAREVMQLFSIGTVLLNDDGTVVTDADGVAVESYDNADVMDGARVWTGFVRRPERLNVEQDNTNRKNMLDPMEIEPNKRDVFPKIDLFYGYLGDGYPLCTELPPRHFLATGARFDYMGSRNPAWHANDGTVSPLTLGADSELFAELCSRNGDKCAFPLRTTLGRHLACVGIECSIERVTIVRLVDGKQSAFYEYTPPPCVQLAFYNDGRVADHRNGADEVVCADPAAAEAGATCCTSSGREVGVACLYAAEYLSYTGLEARCAARGLQMCDSGQSAGTKCGYAAESSFKRLHTWTSSSCDIRVQIDRGGLVSLVHATGEYNDLQSRFKLNNGNNFRVRWAGGSYPTKAAGCPASCTERLETCICLTRVLRTVPFSNAAALPTAAEVEATLYLGSAPPDSHAAGTYQRCVSAACAAANDVELYTRVGGVLDETSIFGVVVNGTLCYRANVLSTVEVGDPGSGATFRNPPHFNSFFTPTADAGTTHDAENEVEALLEKLSTHPNVPPFVSTRLIQRFVTSNPSPRYVQSVSAAFRTGTYNGKAYSGRYGDLGAAIAAVLLDREARSPTLDADPAHGQLREPLLKVIHALRAMELVDVPGKHVELQSLSHRIGQQVMPV